MVRVYFDWNVFSKLKKGIFTDISSFLEINSYILLMPFSQAHFQDLMKSYSPNNKLFFDDIKTLTKHCGKHLLAWDGEKTQLYFCTPEEYLQSELENPNENEFFDLENIFTEANHYLKDAGIVNSDTIIKGLYNSISAGIEITNINKNALQRIFPNLNSESSVWDLIKDIGPFVKNLTTDKLFYKGFRNSIKDSGSKLDMISSSWGENEVMSNINEYLKQKGSNMTFIEIIEYTFKARNEKPTNYEFFHSSYLMLDMLGYKKDKLKKPTDNMGNIQTDADHAFFAAHCDYFVVDDNNLRIKSKLLFKEFNISTTVLDPTEFVSTISNNIGNNNKQEDFILKSFSFCTKENLVHHQFHKEQNCEITSYKIPYFFLNCFNNALYHNYKNENKIILTLRKVFGNYNRYLFYTEVEYVFNIITSYFGISDESRKNELREQYLHNHPFAGISWEFDFGYVMLNKDKDDGRPIVSIVYDKNCD